MFEVREKQHQTVNAGIALSVRDSMIMYLAHQPSCQSLQFSSLFDSSWEYYFFSLILVGNLIALNEIPDRSLSALTVHAINAARSTGFIVGQGIGLALLKHYKSNSDCSMDVPNSTILPLPSHAIHLYAPFLIVSLSGIIGSAFYDLTNSRCNSESEDSGVHPKELSPDSMCHESAAICNAESERCNPFTSHGLRQKLLLVPLLLWFFLIGAREDITRFFFIPAMTEGELNLDFPMAALIAIAFSSFTALGRIMGIIMSNHVHVYAQPAICEALGSIFALGLTFMVTKHHAFIWLYALTVAFTNGPCLSAALNITNHIFKIDSLLLLLCLNLYSVGQFVGVVLCGYLMTYLGPQSFFFTIAISTIVSLISLQVVLTIKKFCWTEHGIPAEDALTNVS